MTIEFKSKIKHPFIMLPVEMEKMGLDVYARAVYQRIVFRAGGHSSHFESQENMAKALFISTRQIKRKIQELEKCKMIEVERRGKSKTGHFLTNVIILEDPSQWIYPSYQVHHSHLARCTTVTSLGDSQSHITRSQDELDLNLTINAVVQQAAAANETKVSKEKKKTWRPVKSSKPKTWEEKSEGERMDSLLNQTCDAHRLAVEQDRRKVKPFPFDDIPDLLLPILKLHGLEKVKEFFDEGRRLKRGYDVRTLEIEINNWINKVEEVENIQEKTVKEDYQSEIKLSEFPEKVIEQVNRNVKFANKTENKEIIEKFPSKFKSFYLSINNKNTRINLQKEILEMGFDNFFQKRATALLRCNYEDLFLDKDKQVSFVNMIAN